jgi:DNA-directed RNA polymerase subunit beta'
MAVHLPLSFEAQLECRLIMLSAHNILHPANGRPIMVPSQDMVIGCYYLTKDRPGQKGEGKCFSSENETIQALEAGVVNLHSRVKVRIKGKTIDTTPGRVVLNQIVPSSCEFVNIYLNKKRLGEIISQVHKTEDLDRTCQFLDDLKDLGFKYATAGGVTVSTEDMIIPPEKKNLIEKAKAEVEKITKQYYRGHITDGERYNKIIDLWTHTTNDVAEVMFEKLSVDRDGFNPIFMMADSGARGSKDQIKQLAGMRGLMAKPQKKLTGQEIIENPILSNFKEGLTVLEYFISTHGARKGLADTALKTADAGYLTRRLVDVAQDLIITEKDCGTILGIEVEALKEEEEVIEGLAERILGRTSQEDIFQPITDKLIIRQGQEINEEISREIEDAGIEKVRIRSVLTCESSRGVCQGCYGRNLAIGTTANIGDAIGIMGAQSIGEPGTQLTLRTFHIGGVAGRITAQSQVKVKKAGKVKYGELQLIEKDSDIVVLGRSGEIFILDDKERVLNRYKVPYGARLLIKEGSPAQKGQIIFDWDPHNLVIIADKSGKMSYHDIKEKKTMQEVYDETTGLKNKVIIPDRDKKLHPYLLIIDSEGKKISSIPTPIGAYLIVDDGASVKAGEVLVKIPRESSKTRDITGGLPRVSELFEARKSKNPAIVSEIDGIAKIGEIDHGSRKVIVTDEHGREHSYGIPLGTHIRVHDGDRVHAGERLSEGPVNPHDILAILGENAVQTYLVNEIQEVYRLQGVGINDKHIECIVRQMLRKVKVTNEGDTGFIEGELVTKSVLREENKRVLDEGGEPATYVPQLLGITKASLGTDSFISAASFQETTKVLSDAAVAGRVDYLRGLKENVIMGNLIPCGTGFHLYRDIKVKDFESEIFLETEEKGDLLQPVQDKDQLVF